MRNVGRWVGVIVTAAVLAAQQLPPVKHVDPLFFTDQVTVDADDPSIWVDPRDPSRSLLICTNK